MNSYCNQAIILAGGRGERLRPLTFDRPKPMIEVFGYPILYYSLKWLKECGFRKVVIACSYKHEVISQYFGNGSSMGIEVDYAIEKEPLGRGGAIKAASTHLEDASSSTLVINGDLITRLALSNLFTNHESSKAKVTIVTVPLHSPYGIVEIDGNDLAVQFREKPTLPYWINAGIYLVKSSMFSQFPDKGDHEEILFPRLAADKQLHVYKFEGFWRTVDTIKDLEELKQDEPVLAQLA